MDRKIFKFSFRKSGLTRYPCPTCGKGRLKVKKDTFHSEETKSSSRRRIEKEWEPECIEYVYSCLFECTNSTCKDIISSSGTGDVSQDFGYDENGNPDVYYEDYFNPEYFTPHLKLFDIPKTAPKSTIDEIENSFSLFFSDPPSSANHIRIALEHLLTHLKIKKFISPKGKRRYLALHQRIELLPKKYDHVKDIFFAIKWLGNAGSHGHHDVTTDDVLDAYELMEDLLVEIFLKNREKLISITKRVNKKKGPK